MLAEQAGSLIVKAADEVLREVLQNLKKIIIPIIEYHCSSTLANQKQFQKCGVPLCNSKDYLLVWPFFQAQKCILSPRNKSFCSQFFSETFKYWNTPSVLPPYNQWHSIKSVVPLKGRSHLKSIMTIRIITLSITTFSVTLN